MQTITKFLVVFILSMVPVGVTAQETNQEYSNSKKIELLQKQKNEIQNDERKSLKDAVEAINKRLESDEITKVEAESLKKAAAEKHALNIENRVAIVDNKIELLKRNPESEDYNDTDNDSNFVIRIGSSDDDDDDDDYFYIGRRDRDRERYRRRWRYDRRTTSDLVFAIGFNNAIYEGEDLNDSNFELAGSGFVELGWAWKTRVFKNTNAVRFKYGFSIMWNKLDIKDNLYFNEENDIVTLEEFPLNVNKSKFRTTNLVFPVHFEFGSSRKVEREDYVRYYTHRKFKIGVGGYAGFNLQSLQKLKYKEDGDKQKDKIKNYNTNNVVYGLSTYLAWGDIGVYLKYDLSPIFKDQEKDLNNISLGLRFDMD